MVKGQGGGFSESCEHRWLKYGNNNGALNKKRNDVWFMFWLCVWVELEVYFRVYILKLSRICGFIVYIVMDG